MRIKANAMVWTITEAWIIITYLIANLPQVFTIWCVFEHLQIMAVVDKFVLIKLTVI